MAHVQVAEIIPFTSYTVTTATAGPFTIPADWAFFNIVTDLRVFNNGVELTYAASPADATEFSVSGTAVDGGFEGGTFTLGGTVENTTITLQRDVPIARTEDFPYPSTTLSIKALNTALDKIAAWAQQFKLLFERSIRLADGDATATLTLPVKATRATKVLAFDADGDMVVSSESLSQIEGAATSATAAAASASTAATDAATATAQATAASNSAASAAASAQGFSGVTLVTASSLDVETTDARSYYQVDATSNTISLNLPSIGTGNDGLSYTIEVLDVSNAITLVRDGSDTINGVDGNYTGLVEAGQVVQIIADDGTPDNWIVVQSSALKVDGTTVELSGRTVRVKNGGVDTAQLAADAVDGTKIADDAVDIEHVADGAIGPVHLQGAVNAQTGTTYTLVIGDGYKNVTMSNASANTLTIPTNASVAFAVGTEIAVWMYGAGTTTVEGASGVTVNGTSAGSTDISNRYSAVSLLKIATNEWFLTGDHGGVS